MPNKIKPKRSYTTNSVPLASDLEPHELAVNWADGKLFTKNAAGEILSFTISGSGAGGISWQPVPASPSASGSNGDIAYDASFLYVKSASGWRRTAIASWAPLSAPTSVTASAGNTQATVNWTAPADNGGYAITDYIVQFSSNAGSTWTTFSDGTSTATSATVTGLTNGTAYVFRVAAVNAVGQGPYSSASGSVTPAAGDPYFSSVALLLHFDGTSFTDSSSNAHTISSAGSVSLSSAQSKFGGVSGYFNAGRLTIADNAVFGVGTGDFTIEMWVYPTSTSYVGGLINLGVYNDGLLWRMGSNVDSLYLNGADSDWSAFTNAPLNTWTHLALVRNGSSVVVYANGVSVHTRTSSADLNASNAVMIGAGAHNTGEAYVGYIDELRITKGVARYTAAFTPPSAPFLDA